MSNLSEEEFIFMVLEDLKSKINFNHNESRFENSTYKNAIQIILDLYNKEKEKNKEIKEYIEEKMYIDDNPTIYGDEEDTITELPISLNLWNEDLRKLLELLEEE